MKIKLRKTDTLFAKYNDLFTSLGNKPRTGSVIMCKYCGKGFYVSPSRVRAKFCSLQCTHLALIKGTSLICEVCGIEYYRPPSQISWRGSSFCSNVCKGTALSHNQVGSKNHQWKGGISTESHRLRASKRWSEWRKAIFERDGYTCQKCYIKSGIGTPVKLHPHHIKPFAAYPELRFEIGNGITLCEQCHKDTHYA